MTRLFFGAAQSLHKLIGAASSAESARAAHKMSDELLSLVRGATEERSRKEREQTQLLVKERDDLRRKVCVAVLLMSSADECSMF